MDSDDEMSDNSDEYASVQLSEDENVNPTQKQAILEEQQKIAEANSDEEEEEEDGEEEGDKTASNFNKTGGSGFQSKKKVDDQESRIEVSLEDRILRNRDRFLVNSTKHPGYQYEDVRKTVIQKTLILSQWLKKKLAPAVRGTVITFITILVYHRDFAAKLKRERIYKVSDFGWQLCMKFNMLGTDKAIEDMEFGPNTPIDPFDENI